MENKRSRGRPENEVKTVVIYKRVHPSIYQDCIDYIKNKTLIVKAKKIDVAKLKVGSVLVAKDTCVMLNGIDIGFPMLTVGKEYEIMYLVENSYFVMNDKKENHNFGDKDIDKYFTIKEY